ncbi:MAG: hypothetical protein WAZ18_00215 [Alphaproteobacteria bacterium]
MSSRLLAAALATSFIVPAQAQQNNYSFKILVTICSNNQVITLPAKSLEDCKDKANLLAKSNYAYEGMCIDLDNVKKSVPLRFNKGSMSPTCGGWGVPGYFQFDTVISQKPEEPTK